MLSTSHKTLNFEGSLLLNFVPKVRKARWPKTDKSKWEKIQLCTWRCVKCACVDKITCASVNAGLERWPDAEKDDWQIVNPGEEKTVWEAIPLIDSHTETVIIAFLQTRIARFGSPKSEKYDYSNFTFCSGLQFIRSVHLLAALTPTPITSHSTWIRRWRAGIHP